MVNGGTLRAGVAQYAPFANGIECGNRSYL